jgi:hypothetical protein
MAHHMGIHTEAHDELQDTKQSVEADAVLDEIEKKSAPKE